jgi:hypothetical protein
MNMLSFKHLRRNWCLGFVATLLLGTGSLAAEQCNFTLECFEGENCSETTFSMQIEGNTLVTDAETIPVSSGGSDKVNVFVGYTPSAFHVLTREKGGAARYSTHIFDGVLMVNYIGTCE